MPRLAGRVALITGAGSGIGRASAQLFAREGARIVIADIDARLGRSTEQLVREAGGEAILVKTDVTNDESVHAAVDAAEERFGKLDVLFNCAGGSLHEDAPLGQVDVASVWNRTMHLDLLGTIHCCHHAMPAMVRAGGGAVVNMSSGTALRGASPAHIYSAAKGGILSLTRALAGAYARHAVRVNAICAGRILTERIVSRYGTPDRPGPLTDLQQADERVREYPFWVGRPEDVANIALPRIGRVADDHGRQYRGRWRPLGLLVDSVFRSEDLEQMFL
jgi:NAD(P)-dependent dehydrogenase (short-subunit alcohol dehydrogenase family)